MVRSLFVAMGLLIAGSSLGCSMCQDCLDQTGTVPDAPNFGNYEHSPRVGSVAPVSAETPILAPGEEFVGEETIVE